MRSARLRLSSLLLLLLLPLAAEGLNQDGILLLSFKYSILSDPLAALSSWTYADATPCSWNGVACAAVAGDPTSRVISLVMPNARLLGSIPFGLGILEHLRHLDLANNSLNGTLPSSLFRSSNLRLLSLARNEISGEIPDQVGNLSSLEVLNLSDNALMGRVPVSLALLPNLTVVSLRSNYFSGGLPGGGFTSVEVLDLSSNLINGSIPENGVGGNGLKYLNLSYNQLFGEIPPAFAAVLPSNATVDLSFNNLTGSIPVAASLISQKPNAFSGNPGLCGRPLRNLCSIPSTLSDPPPNGTGSPVDSSTSLPSEGRNSPPAFAAIPKTIDGGIPGGVGGNGTREQQRQGDGKATPGQQSGLRPTVIAGIVVGDLGGIGLLFLVFFYVYHSKKKKSIDNNQQSYSDDRNLKQSRMMVVQKPPSSAATAESKGVTALSLCMGKKSGSDDSEETSETATSDSDPEESGSASKSHHNPEQKGGGLLVSVDGETELELETLLKASAYILGATGSSIVYKAVLADGTAFAVRRIGEGGAADKLRDFDAQVRGIARLRHPNLVRIRGFYWGSDERLLICDYATNGSLANVSYKKMGSSPYHLPWDARLRIAKGVARGLAFIHDKKAVHGNLKPSNILLGADMEPRIGDFGLERLTSGADTGSSRPGASFRHIGSKRSTLSQSSLQEPSPTGASPCSLGGGGNGGASSTPYHAPECLKNLKPSPKWDVYSFGVVLLELLTGRAMSEAELLEWNAAEELGRVLRMADAAMRAEAEGSEEALLSCFRLGFGCASAVPQRRPSMKEVVQVLDRVVVPSSRPSSASSPLPPQFNH